MTVRTRFAPSPTGFLHVGNARTALFNWLVARHHGGAFLLRLEDTDRARFRPEFESGIQEELRWLGLEWDEGIDRPGTTGPYRQSERAEQGIYARAFERLLEADHAYLCFCPPSQLEADREEDRLRGRSPRYTGRCRALSPDEARARKEGGEPAVGRLRVREGPIWFEDRIRGRVEVDSAQIGDPVLLRSNGWPTYNFAVVVDDIGMGITDVIRGEDHLSNTPLQILLYRTLGADPPRFAHLPLVLAPDRTPLSKRHGDSSLRQFREQGYLPEAVMNYLALLGWSAPGGAEVLSPEDLIREFDLSRVNRSAGIFDPVKLQWLGNQHLRRRDSRMLAEEVRPHLDGAGLLPRVVSPAVRTWLEHLMDLLKESISRMDEVPASEGVRILLAFDPLKSLGDSSVRKVLDDSEAARVITIFARRLAGEGGPLDPDRYHAVAEEVGRETGTRGKRLFRPIRIALTGEVSGPELARLIPLIEETARLELPRPAPGCAERSRRVAAIVGGA